MKRSERREAEGKMEMKRNGRYREMERDDGRGRKRLGKRELGLSASLALGKKIFLFCFALGRGLLPCVMTIRD